MQTKREAANDKAGSLGQSPPDWWMVRLTGVIVLLGGIQTIVFWVQAKRLKQTIEKMDEIAMGQTKDIQASIAEATRAAKAMEKVSESMEASVQSLQVSVGISREIADRQKLVTELQSRAYLSAVFHTAIFQDANHIFEAHAVLRNHGNTPAYDVTFRSVVQIVPLPLPDDFAFPLPDDTAGSSVSLIAPGMTKLITRSIPDRVPDDQVDAIKRGGPPFCLAMWGTVNYRDAFKETRHLRFAFFINWIPWLEGMGKDKDGNPLLPQIMSYDTAHHNDAD